MLATGDRGGGIQIEVLGEHRQPLQQALLGLRQNVVAPVQAGGQRNLDAYALRLQYSG